jgi:hypothetical protein
MSAERIINIEPDVPETLVKGIYTVYVGGKPFVVEFAEGSKLVTGDPNMFALGAEHNYEIDPSLTPNEAARQKLADYLVSTLGPTSNPSGSVWEDRKAELIRYSGVESLAVLFPSEILAEKMVAPITRILNALARSSYPSTISKLREYPIDQINQLQKVKGIGPDSLIIVKLLKDIVDTMPQEDQTE